LEATVEVGQIMEFLSVTDEHLKFHKVVLRYYSDEVFTWHCSKHIQETVYEISSESPEFCRSYYKNMFSFFPDTLYFVQLRGPPMG